MSSDDFITFYQSDLRSASFVAFEDMRKHEELCDLRITAGNDSIFAHKVILAAGIPYFRDLFTTRRTQDEEKYITALDPGALKSLINFAYTSRVTISADNAQSLLLAAEFLRLNQVRDSCIEFLSKRINTSNVVQIRTLACTLNIWQLTEKSDNYIRQNFESFSKSGDFLNLSSSHVKEIISQDDLSVSSEETVFEAVMNWVKAWPSEREAELPALLGEVRMVLFPIGYLIKNVCSEGLIRNSLSCRDLIQSAQSYHLLSKQESAYLNLKTQPRKHAIKKAVYAVCASGFEEYSIYFCDFRSGIWNKMSSRKIQEDYCYGVAATNGNVYMFLQNTIHMFDSGTHIWKMLEPRHEHLDGAAVVVHGSNIYFFGSGGGGFGDRVRRFDTMKTEWLPEERMTMRRSYCAAASLGEGVYVTGGLYYADEILDTVERYAGSNEEWSKCCPMITSRYLHGCACINEKIYVCGGMTITGPSNSSEMYDPLTDLWSYIPSMMTERHSLSLVPYENKIYALGGVGSNGKFSVDSEIYDSRCNHWEFGFSVPEGFQNAVLSS